MRQRLSSTDVVLLAAAPHKKSAGSAPRQPFSSSQAVCAMARTSPCIRPIRDIENRVKGAPCASVSSGFPIRQSHGGAHGATNKEHHVCVRRRDGEAAGSGTRSSGEVSGGPCHTQPRNAERKIGRAKVTVGDELAAPCLRINRAAKQKSFGRYWAFFARPSTLPN